MPWRRGDPQTNFHEDKRPIGMKWVNKTKSKPNGEFDRIKARLVVERYKQKPWIDYFKEFTLVARLDTVRVLISVSYQNNWKIYQMDVKPAFLNGTLKEEVYIEQPVGYEIKGTGDKIYRLKKSIIWLEAYTKGVVQIDWLFFWQH